MAKLIYSAIASLDQYIEDESGKFGWAAPDDEVFAFVTDLERPVGIYLYGRRMYETMVYWDTADVEGSHAARDWAEMWRAADKIVFSRTLQSVSSARTRLERDFDPAAIGALKDASELDITIGGPHLAAQALAHGLVDELQLFLVPVLVGAGKPALPSDVRVGVELLNERRFKSGVVYLQYAVKST
jgi:dihydrofolate reductase